MLRWNKKTKTVADANSYTSSINTSPADMQQWINSMQSYQMPKYTEPEPVNQSVYVVNKYDIANDMNFDVAVFTSVEFAEAFIERQSHDGFDWDWQEFTLDEEVINEEPIPVEEDAPNADTSGFGMFPNNTGTYYTSTSSI